MMKKTYLYMAVALMWAACSGKPSSETAAASHPAQPEASEQPVADSLTASQVDAVTSATNVANSPTFNGLMQVAPNQQATLSLTMGGRIASLSVIPGTYVHKGQVVATIDNPEFIELQQTYLEASAQAAYLAQEYERQSALGAYDVASKKKIQQSKADYLSMKSRLEAAVARLHLLGIDEAQLQQEGLMTYLPVTAPFAGYVTNIDVNLGKYLEPGQPICDIINKSKSLLQLTVYEKDLSLMRVGRQLLFRVNGLGKSTFPAEIISIDQSIDEKDYSIKVYARVATDRPEFRPGMYIRARLVEE